MEYNPRSVFEKLFGDSGSTDRNAREARLQQHRSILDSVQREACRPAARARARTTSSGSNEYTESIRDVERRIQRAEEQRELELPTMEQPQGVPPIFEDHLAVDVRSATAGVPVGPDARHLVHDQQGTERPAVSADRRAGGAPPALAPRRFAGSHRAHVEDQPVPRRALREVRRAGWPRRRTATARCSITPPSCMAPASRTATRTPATTCRSCSSVAVRPPQGPVSTSSTRTSRRWPTCSSR